MNSNHYIQQAELMDCIPGMLHAFSPVQMDNKYYWARNDNPTIEWYDTPEMYLKSQTYFVCASMEMFVTPTYFREFVRHSYRTLILN